MKLALTNLLLSLLIAGSAWANDSEAILEGGNLRLKKSSQVVMLTEDLTIEADRVRVRYTFRNEGSQDIKTIVAFPMRVENREGNVPRTDTPATGFTVKCDGVSQPTRIKRRGVGDWIEFTEYWKQRFPAGKTVTIEHDYDPLGGFITPGPSASDAQWRSIGRTYGIEGAMLHWIKKRSGYFRQVHYILTTGANWKGPIRQFRLTIKKSSPDQKIFPSLFRFKKIDAVTFQVTRKNFTPTEELKVLFAQ